MKTDVDSDVEIIEMLDFEITEPCDCTLAKVEAADWVCRCRTCGNLMWLCHPHLGLLDLQILSLPKGAQCVGCKSGGRTLMDIFDVIPVKGNH